jgi:two-component system, cell cycle sensor histidine kinase and response regulator CckA
MSTPENNNASRILVIDDNAAIHEDFRKVLGAQTSSSSRLTNVENALFGEPSSSVERATFRIDSAFQGQEGLELVKKALEAGDPYSMAFVDIRMPPGWDGVETIEQIWKVCPELQTVICTAYSDYSWDDFIRRFGHTDNLLILKKPFETVEVLQIAHALTKKWILGRQARLRMEDLDRMVQERTKKLQEEIVERTRVQEALRVSEERFSKAFQSSPMPMAIQTWPEGVFLSANSSFLELTGYSTDKLLQHNAAELQLWDGGTGPKLSPQSEVRIRNQSCVLRRCDHTMRNTVLWTEPIILDAKECLLVVVEDVTEQLKLESQLRQSQKLEIVGRLVASIAHEFNNVLTVIQGHATLLHSKLASLDMPTESVERIVQASQRAASFTGQLLAFSRKQPVNFKATNLSECAQTLRKMLGQLLGERHELKLDLMDNLPLTRANEGSVEQVLINLALNARDAMPNGGVITVGTNVVMVNETELGRHPEARPGQYVCLTVSDTGCGIAREMVSRIFDPFFTTKEVGKGTGLGLSMVQSIVQQHQGWIEVDSEIGKGSTFRALFPVTEGAVAAKKTPLVIEPVRDGGTGETVMVVEDEPTVREMARTTLEQGGFRVLEAADGKEALQVWDQSDVPISLVVTDIVMPNGVSGGALAKTLQERSPNLQVVCTSGYNPEFIKKDMPMTRGIVFLPKPYDPNQLLKAVRKCLEGDPVALKEQNARHHTELAGMS